MAGTNTNNKIKTTVELDVSQVQRQIVKLNGSASDTTKKLEDRIKDKNKAVELQNKLSKKVLTALKKENDSLKKAGASTKEITASTKKLNAEKLKSAKASAANTKQLNKLNASSKKSSKGMGFLKIAIAASAAAFALVVKKGAEFAKALSSLEAVSGATNKEMKMLSRQAKELGASTAFTASEVVSLQTELAKLGNSASDIEKSTPAILNLAASLEVGLADAASFAGSTVNSFGLEASDTQRIVDIMAESAASSAQDFYTLKESFTQAAPAASALGVSVEKTSALLGVLANSGITGGAAGTALKNSFIELKNQGLTLQQGLDKIANSSDKLGTAIELAGKRGGPALLILSKNAGDIDELETKLNGAAGAAERMAEIKLNNLSGDVTKLQSAFEGFVLGIFSGDGAMNDFLRTIVQGASKVLNFFTATEKVSDSLKSERLGLRTTERELDRLDDKIIDSTTSQEDLNKATAKRVSLINDLKKAHPQHLKDIDAETISTDALKKSLKAVNEELVNKIIIQERQEEIQEQAVETADALSDLLEKEAKINSEIDNIRLRSRTEINATDAEGVVLALSRLKQERKLDVYEQARFTNLLEAMQAKEFAQRSFNIEEKIGLDLLEKKEKLEDRLLGKSVNEEVKKTIVDPPKPNSEEEEAVDMLNSGETDEEKEIREKAEAVAKKAREKKEAIAKKAREKKEREDKRARDKEKKDIVDFKKGVIKDSENLEADSETKKVELERKRHLAKLDALALEDDEKLKQKIKVDAIYDQKIKAINDKADEDADALKLEKEVLDREIQLEKEFIEMQRLLENDKLTAKERIKLHQEYLDKKTEIEVLAAAGNKDDIDKINKKAKGAKEKIQTAELKAEDEKLKAELDMNVNTALESFGIAQEVSVAKMIMNAPEAIGNSFAAAAKNYAPPISLAMGAIGAAGVIVPIMKGLSDIKKTRFSAGGRASKPTSGGAPPTSGAGPTAVSVADVENLSGSNASRLGTDASLNSRASSDAANGGMLSGAKSGVVFSENAYSNFQSQVDFREDKTTL